MTNAPTNNATIANTSKNVLKNERLSLMSFACSFASWSPVIASSGGASSALRNCGSCARSVARTPSCDTPDFARTSIWSHVPDAIHQLLGAVRRERSQRGAGEAVLLAAELHDAGEPERLRLARLEA